MERLKSLLYVLAYYCLYEDRRITRDFNSKLIQCFFADLLHDAVNLLSQN